MAAGRTHQFHPPDADQLKELGIKPPAAVDEINDPPGNTAVDESGAQKRDNLILADLAEATKKRKRWPRRAVSAARSSSDRSVPTVLGGHPPGLSVLARREFGLRVLRR